MKIAKNTQILIVVAIAIVFIAAAVLIALGKNRQENGLKNKNEITGGANQEVNTLDKTLESLTAPEEKTASEPAEEVMDSLSASQPKKETSPSIDPKVLESLSSPAK